MENSIEKIWKEGFLSSDVLVAPKLNDLYNQKSIDVIDKFKRMYEVNVIAIVAFSFIILPVSFVTETAYMGILMFILFNTVVLINRKFKKKLGEIDKSLNSYQYLKSFDNWMQEVLLLNEKMNRYIYAYIFLSILIGFWFGGIGGDIPGNVFLSNFLADYPNTYLFLGLPMFGILGIVIILFLLSFFGARIGKYDFNLVYGRILKKINELLSDMEELRAQE